MARKTKAEKEAEAREELVSDVSKSLIRIVSEKEKIKSISWTEQNESMMIYSPSPYHDEDDPIRSYKYARTQSPTHLISKSGFDYIKKHGIEGESETVCREYSPGPEEDGADLYPHPKKGYSEYFCEVCLEAFKRSGLPVSKLPDEKWVEVYGKYVENNTSSLGIPQKPKVIIRKPIRPEPHVKAEEIAQLWQKGKPFSLHGFEFSVLRKTGEYIDLQMRVENVRIWAERRMFASKKSYLGKFKIYRSVFDHQKAGSLIVTNQILWLVRRAKIVTSPENAVLGQSTNKDVDIPWPDDSNLLLDQPSIRSSVRISMEPIQQAQQTQAA